MTISWLVAEVVRKYITEGPVKIEVETGSLSVAMDCDGIRLIGVLWPEDIYHVLGDGVPGSCDVFEHLVPKGRDHYSEVQEAVEPGVTFADVVRRMTAPPDWVWRNCPPNPPRFLEKGR